MASRTSVFLNVADIERSLAFYKALGFKVVSSTKMDDGRVAYADLEMDGAELGLGSIASNDDPEYRAWVGTPLGAGVVLYLTVPSTDRVFEKARKAGAVVEMEPRDRPYGRVATVNDPDGYVLTFHQEPAKPRKAARRKAPAAGKARTAKSTRKAKAKRAKARRAR